MKLTQKERDRIRASIIEDLCDPERPTPAAKIELKLKVLMEDVGENTKDTLPAVEVADLDPDEIGDFPTMH